MIKEYLKYSVDKNKTLLIEHIKGNEFYIDVLRYEEEDVVCKFFNSGEDARIKIKNIKSCKFKDNEVEKEFCYSQTNKQYNQKDIKSTIEDFKKYYIEILKLLKNNEKDSSNNRLYENKYKIYEKNFRNLHSQKDNILFSYFTGEKGEEIDSRIKQENNTKPVILLQQSNISQKKSIDSAIKEKISIIEGPPGTGKITTIISIIANMICENKKVVVSKNNSAIDNVLEELEKMPLPDFFIRIGNKEIMDNLYSNIEEKISNYEKQIKDLSINSRDETKEELKALCDQLENMENKLDQLIKTKNKLNELKNQYNHLVKRRKAYNFYEFEEEWNCSSRPFRRKIFRV